MCIRDRVYRSGRLFLFVNPKEVQAVSCPVAEDNSTKLSAGDFQTVYHDVTGNRGSGFYIRFLEVPAAGDLYANNGATRLTAASIGEKAFSYQSISSLSYTAGAADSSVRYLSLIHIWNPRPPRRPGRCRRPDRSAASSGPGWSPRPSTPSCTGR